MREQTHCPLKAQNRSKSLYRQSDGLAHMASERPLGQAAGAHQLWESETPTRQV
jgi:hypothetical protein